MVTNGNFKSEYYHQQRCFMATSKITRVLPFSSVCRPPVRKVYIRGVNVHECELRIVVTVVLLSATMQMERCSGVAVVAKTTEVRPYDINRLSLQMF